LALEQGLAEKIQQELVLRQGKHSPPGTAAQKQYFHQFTTKVCDCPKERGAALHTEKYATNMAFIRK
jgi:hypothetical protein